MITVEKGGCQW